MKLVQMIIIILFLGRSFFIFSSDQLNKKTDWLDRMLLRVSKKEFQGDLNRKSIQYIVSISDDEGDDLNTREEKQAARKMFVAIGAYQKFQRVSTDLQMNTVHRDIQSETGRMFIKDRFRNEISRFRIEKGV